VHKVRSEEKEAFLNSGLVGDDSSETLSKIFKEFLRKMRSEE
jgi:hypothetical protein